MAKGKLIVIEAGDGCGKATQTALLYEHLRKDGLKLKKVEFPDYESPAAMPLKMYLNGDFGSEVKAVNAYAASTFFAIDRYASYHLKWREHYEAGGIVLADRYTTSNLVHQAVKIEDRKTRENFFTWLDDFEFNKLGLPRPDCVIFLDMKPAIAARLIKERGKSGRASDIHEKDEAYLARCHTAYAELAKRFGWEVIPSDDGTAPFPVETIQAKIYAVVKRALA